MTRLTPILAVLRMPHWSLLIASIPKAVRS
jgi:hypothetical protein